MPTPSPIEPLGHLFLDLVFPRLCPGCGHALGHRHQPQLCASCASQLHRLEPPFCAACGEKFHGLTMPGQRCANCHGRDLAFDFARSSFYAQGLLRDLVHRLKYQRALHLAPLLAHLLEQNLEDPRIQARNDWVLVPVALHARRERARRFNQAAELAQLTAACRGWASCDALCRSRPSIPQADLDREDRLRNLRGAFALRNSAWIRRQLDEAPVLLVDDVLTTGATAHECAKVLKENANVSKVVVVSVARAGNPASG